MSGYTQVCAHVCGQLPVFECNMALTHFSHAGFSGPVLRRRSALAQMSRLALGSLAALSVGLGLLVLWRRISMVPGVAAPWPAGLLSGLVCATVAGALRTAWAVDTPRRASRVARLLRSGLPSLVPLGWGLAVSLPPVSVSTLVVFWSLVVLEEIWGWGLGGRCWLRRRVASPNKPAAGRAPSPAADHLPPPAASRPAGLAPGVPSHAMVETEVEGQVLEQLTRCRLADGAEQIAGWLAADFAPGQRTDSLHVAFCPPLARTPELQIEQIEGPRVRVKTGQLQPYGVRLDLKLAEPASKPQRVVLGFAARAPS